MRTTTPTPQPVTAYLHQGGFGQAVVTRLAQPQDAVLHVHQNLVRAVVPYADRLVLVAHPDRTELRRDLDALSFTRAIPSLGLELLPTELRCGPLVIPGRTACYHCYERRRRQHGYQPLPAELEPLAQGYAHHHVVLGAGLISMALDLLDGQSVAGDDGAAAGGAGDERGLGGQVWSVDLVSGSSSSAQTVAVDRCKTCSARFAPRRRGPSALAALLPGGAASSTADGATRSEAPSSTRQAVV